MGVRWKIQEDNILRACLPSSYIPTSVANSTGKSLRSIATRWAGEVTSIAHITPVGGWRSTFCTVILSASRRTPVIEVE
jgi:hypothetical protein